MIAALTFWPTLIVALIDSGQLDRAADLVDRLDDAAAARALDFEARLAACGPGWPWPTAGPKKPASHFETALARFDTDDPFLDRALTHHAYGQLLRARGERRQAVTQLRDRPSSCSAPSAPTRSSPGSTPTWPQRASTPPTSPVAPHWS